MLANTPQEPPGATNTATPVETNAMDQVTNVSPGDWAFEALRSLVELLQ